MNELLVFVPIIFMIIYTVVSHRVLEPIIGATVLAYIFKYQWQFLFELIDGIQRVIRGESLSYIIVLLLSFGAMIHIIKVSNGITALERFMSSKLKGRKSTLFVTWLLGILLFMDDYLNSLIVGSTMKNITDKYHIPREKVALLAISTGVPICIIAPVSSWAVFLFGVLTVMGFDVSRGLMGTHLAVVPYAVYPLISIVGAFALAVGILKPLFGLKKAYIRAETDFAVPGGNPIKLVEEHETEGKLLNFLLPLGSLILISIVTADVVLGAAVALIVALLWLTISRQMSLSAYVEHCIAGMSELVHPLVLMMFAFVFSGVLGEMGFAETVIGLIGHLDIQIFLPAIIFLATGVIVFGGVDVWAVMPLVLPVFVPLANQYGINPYMAIGAVLSGISFGTQMCFISESHILISTTLDLKPIQQVKTLAPYALSYGVLTTIAYVLMGMYM